MSALFDSNIDIYRRHCTALYLLGPCGGPHECLAIRPDLRNDFTDLLNLRGEEENVQWVSVRI